MRLLEKFKPSDPPTTAELQHCRDWLRDFIGQKVHATLAPILADGKDHTRLVGTGGTASILARMECGMNDYDRVRIEATRLNAEALSRWVERLWSLPLAERRFGTGFGLSNAQSRLQVGDTAQRGGAKGARASRPLWIQERLTRWQNPRRTRS